jgi:hypothetical protein
MATKGLRNTWGSTGETARSTYTVAGFVADRTYNAGTAVVAETNQVLASLIQDLIAQGIIEGTVSA